MSRKSNDLFDLLRSLTQEMANEYDRIRKRAPQDPGTAGDQGEENWASLLRGWLSPIYPIVTKGRIMSHDGNAGPQVDVLVLSPSYPKELLDKKVYLAGGVVAAFECKVTLRPEHIRAAVENAVKIRRDLPPRLGTPYKELHSPIIYGLLAHSHTWKERGSRPRENVGRTLYASDRLRREHPREMLDLLCVADLATWFSFKYANLDPINPTRLPSGFRVMRLSAKILTGHMFCSSRASEQAIVLTPIGGLLTKLLERLAWDDPGIRRLAEYFIQAEIGGQASGPNARRQQSDIFSDFVRDTTTRPELISDARWNEWRASFD